MIPLSLAAIAQLTGALPHLVADPGVTAGSVVIDSRAGPRTARQARLPASR